MANESVSKETFRKLQFISKGKQTGGISAVKIPKYDWFYFLSADKLFRYSKGDFYTHH